MGHNPNAVGTFRKRFWKNSGKTGGAKRTENQNLGKTCKKSPLQNQSWRPPKVGFVWSVPISTKGDAPSRRFRFGRYNLKMCLKQQPEESFLRISLGLQFGALLSKKTILGTYQVDSHTPLPKGQPQKLTFPLRQAKFASDRGKVKLGELW